MIKKDVSEKYDGRWKNVWMCSNVGEVSNIIQQSERLEKKLKDRGLEESLYGSVSSMELVVYLPISIPIPKFTHPLLL